MNEIEVMAVGKCGSRYFSDSDLDQMVTNFDELKNQVKPVLKSDVRKDGQPNLGQMSNLKKIGSKLVATFSNIPKRVQKILSEKKYSKIMPAIYSSLDVGGRKYSNVLASVSIGGSDIPVVNSLQDLKQFFSEDFSYGNLQTYSMNVNDGIITEEKKVKYKVNRIKMDGQDLDAVTTKYCEEHPGITYSDALIEMGRKYSFDRGPAMPVADQDLDLDAAAMAYQDQNGCSYEDALAAVI